MKTKKTVIETITDKNKNVIVSWKKFNAKIKIKKNCPRCHKKAIILVASVDSIYSITSQNITLYKIKCSSNKCNISIDDFEKLPNAINSWHKLEQSNFVSKIFANIIDGITIWRTKPFTKAKSPRNIIIPK